MAYQVVVDEVIHLKNKNQTTICLTTNLIVMSLEKQIKVITGNEARENKIYDIVVSLKRADTQASYRDFIEELTEVYGTKMSAVNSRELMPPSAAMVNVDKPMDTNLKRRLERTNLLASKTIIASNEFRERTHGEADLGKARHPINQLLDEAFFTEAISKASSRKKDFEQPVPFYSADSFFMKIRGGDLGLIGQHLPEDARVYPNKTMRIPSIFKSHGMPEIVNDNKSYTWGVAKTGALASWGAYNAKGQGVKVAILDTGIDPDHQDLAGKIEDFAEFDYKGDIVLEGVENAYDSNGHGTHCAGTIVGGNKSGRWIGMAPEAKLLVGLVLKNGSGTISQILAGMDWALKKGADVINLSLGSLSFDPEVNEIYTRVLIEANRRGVMVVVSVGNDGSQTSGPPGNDMFAYTVGATNFEDNIAGFSGGRTQIIRKSDYIHGSNLPIVYSKPDISAPGVEIYSCVPGNKYNTWNGTSMAAPHVSGAIAQLLSDVGRMKEINPYQRVNIIQSLLNSSVRELGECGQDHRYGIGRLDILRAIGYAINLGYW